MPLGAFKAGCPYTKYIFLRNFLCDFVLRYQMGCKIYWYETYSRPRAFYSRWPWPKSDPGVLIYHSGSRCLYFTTKISGFQEKKVCRIIIMQKQYTFNSTSNHSRPFFKQIILLPKCFRVKFSCSNQSLLSTECLIHLLTLKGGAQSV